MHVETLLEHRLEALGHLDPLLLLRPLPGIAARDQPPDEPERAPPLPPLFRPLLPPPLLLCLLLQGLAALLQLQLDARELLAAGRRPLRDIEEAPERIRLPDRPREERWTRGALLRPRPRSALRLKATQRPAPSTAAFSSSTN